MSAVRRVLIAAATVVIGLSTPAYASRDNGSGGDNHSRCPCQHQQWDDRYYDGPYCEGPPPREDEHPMCGGDDDYGPANTPTTRDPNTTTTTRLADEAGTSSTTVAPPVLIPPAVMIHQDPKPEVKAVVVDRPPAATKPAPMQELPRTGGETGLLISGYLLIFGGAGVMVGRKK